MPPKPRIKLRLMANRAIMIISVVTQIQYSPVLPSRANTNGRTNRATTTTIPVTQRILLFGCNLSIDGFSLNFLPSRFPNQPPRPQDKDKAHEGIGEDKSHRPKGSWK